MARLWTELRSALVADGRLDEDRVAGAKAQMLAQLRAHEIAEASEASGADRTVRKVRDAKNGTEHGTTAPEPSTRLAASERTAAESRRTRSPKTAPS